MAVAVVVVAAETVETVETVEIVVAVVVAWADLGVRLKRQLKPQRPGVLG